MIDWRGICSGLPDDAGWTKLLARGHHRLDRNRHLVGALKPLRGYRKALPALARRQGVPQPMRVYTRGIPIPFPDPRLSHSGGSRPSCRV